MLLTSLQQLLIFLYFFILGGVFAPVFALDRFFFAKIKKKKIKKFSENFYFSIVLILFFVVFFLLAMVVNFGIIRYYMALGAGLGFLTMCKLFLKPLAFILKKTYTYINKLINNPVKKGIENERKDR